MTDNLEAQVARIDRATIDAIRLAIAPHVVATPLLPARDGLWLKPECLQPFGSFKLRGAASAVAALPPDTQAIATASAGNFAQGLTGFAVRRGIRVKVHVPDSAPEVKRAAIRRLGGDVVVQPFSRWWAMLTEGATGADDGQFVHPFADARVIAGNATIGFELAEAMPDLARVIVPFGGGGLAIGIAIGLRAGGSSARVVACEVATAAPLTASFSAGEPVTIEREPSFVDGIGSLRVLDAIWPLARTWIEDSVTVTPDAAAAALRTIALRHGLIVEGAAAVAYAASGQPSEPTVAILTGRNIDTDVALGMIGATQ